MKASTKENSKKVFSLSYLAPCFAGEESRGGSATLTDKNCIFFAMQIMHFLTICIFSQLYFGQWQRVRFFLYHGHVKEKRHPITIVTKTSSKMSFLFFLSKIFCTQ